MRDHLWLLSNCSSLRHLQICGQGVAQSIPRRDNLNNFWTSRCRSDGKANSSYWFDCTWTFRLQKANQGSGVVIEDWFFQDFWLNKLGFSWWCTSKDGFLFKVEIVAKDLLEDSIVFYHSECFNGEIVQCFEGLHQGDPLSPISFVIAVEVLTQVFLKAQNLGLIKRFKIKRNSVGIPIL